MSDNQKKTTNTELLPKTIQDITQDITDVFENGLPVVKDRLNKFVEEFDKEFSLEKGATERGSAEALTWALMGSPILLYAVSMNGSAITELHSILERLTIRETSQQIASKERFESVYKLIERYTLPDLVSVLVDLSLMDRDDLKFTKKLSRLRNGVAHKNPRIISNAVLSGKQISFLDIDAAMANIDCVPLIINSIKFLMKLLVIGKQRSVT
jgi:hypothetical protein